MYLSLGKIKDRALKESLKSNFRQIVCSKCRGTGAGWEADVAMIGRRSVHGFLATGTLRDVLGINERSNVSLLAAKKLGLSGVKVSARIGDLSSEVQNRLLVAAVVGEPLHEVSIISGISDARSKRIAAGILSKNGMHFLSDTKK